VAHEAIGQVDAVPDDGVLLPAGAAVEPAVAAASGDAELGLQM